MAIKLFSQHDYCKYLDLIRDKYSSVVPPHPRHDFINVEKHVIRLGLDWDLIKFFYSVESARNLRAACNEETKRRNVYFG